MFEDYFQKGGIGGFCFASSDNIKSKNAMNHLHVIHQYQHFACNNLKRWEQYCKLPWPDSLCFYLRGLVSGHIRLHDSKLFWHEYLPTLF